MLPHDERQGRFREACLFDALLLRDGLDSRMRELDRGGQVLVPLGLGLLPSHKRGDGRGA